MDDQKKVRVEWDNQELLKNPRRWSTFGDRPLPSPFPHTNSRAKKSVLGIDGRGLRGYSSLVILQALMEEIGKIERAYNPKATSGICSSAVGPLDGEIRAATNPDAMPISDYWPCHYFDCIAGIGTGGAIAMMLGRYRMSVGEAMDRYRDVCATVVQQRRMSPSPKHRWRESLFPRKHKASRCLNACAVKLGPALPGHFQSDPKRCHTIVYGCDSNLQPLRSYAVSDLPRSVNDILLQCLGGEPSRESYYCAKHFHNNPSRTVLEEVSSLPDHNLSGSNGIDLLSIGGAMNEPVNRGIAILQYLRSMQIRRGHKEPSIRPGRFNISHYCRLDVRDADLQDIGVNERRPESSDQLAFRRIEEATNEYLRNKDTANELHIFARRLVDKRRLRAETLQWER